MNGDIKNFLVLGALSQSEVCNMSCIEKKIVRVKDLKDELVMSKERTGWFLYCTQCGAEYSAHSGDYWNRAPDYEFICGCGNPLILAIKHIIIEQAV